MVCTFFFVLGLVSDLPFSFCSVHTKLESPTLASCSYLLLLALLTVLLGEQRVCHNGLVTVCRSRWVGNWLLDLMVDVLFSPCLSPFTFPVMSFLFGALPFPRLHPKGSHIHMPVHSFLCSTTLGNHCLLPTLTYCCLLCSL